MKQKLSKRIQQALRIAEKYLDECTHPNYRLVCVLLKGDTIRSIGINRKAPKYFYVPEGIGVQGRHAEIDCLHRMDKRLTKGATLLIIGESAAGNGIKTKPCASCMKVIQNMLIKRVFYQESNGQLECVKV